MANAAGMLKESIWRDKEFRALPRTAQATYAQLISQKELDRAGIQPLQVTKWAKGCDAITDSDIYDDLKLLEQHRFVFVDEDTDELFIRSYMRHCEVARYPNILKNALRCAGLVASEKIRHELAKELRRLRKADAERVADAIEPADYHPEPLNGNETQSNPSETLPQTVPEGLNGSGTPLEPQGYGSGSGSVTLASTSVGEAPSKFCRDHPNGTTDPCGPCMRARLAHEQWQDEQAAIEADRRRLDAERVAACPFCRGTNWLLDDDGNPTDPAIRCQHPGVP